jgi:hypothetical protein
MILLVGLWTAAYAALLALGLSIYRNRVTGACPLLPLKGMVQSVAGGFGVGFIAGALAQVLLALLVWMAPGQMWPWMVGWTVMALLVAAGLSWVVADLPLCRAIVAGTFGGAVGSGLFVLAMRGNSEVGGRLGAAVVIGLAIGLAVTLQVMEPDLADKLREKWEALLAGRTVVPRPFQPALRPIGYQRLSNSRRGKPK